MASNFGDKKIVQNRNNIQKLQNRAFRKITFKKLHDPVKFKDLLPLQNCLFVSQIEENHTWKIFCNPNTL